MNKHKLIASSILVIISIIGISLLVHASTPVISKPKQKQDKETKKITKSSLRITTLDSGDTSVTLKWTGIGTYYTIHRVEGEQQRLLTKTIKTSYIDQKLFPQQPYKYVIKAYDKQDAIIQEAVIKTFTQGVISLTTKSIKKRSNTNEEATLSGISAIPISTVLTNQYTHVIWSRPDGYRKFNVLKNGQFIKSTNELQFFDETDGDGSPLDIYTIHGEKPLTFAQKDSIRYWARKYDLVISEEDLNRIKNEIILVKIVETLQKQRLSATKNVLKVANTKETPGLFKIRYQTFIPTEFVKNPFRTVSQIEYFGGDNRSFDYNSDKFRTRTELNVCLCAGGNTAEFNKKIGITRAYNSQFKLIREAQESGKGIKGRIEKIKGREPKPIFAYKVTHASGNPLVISPDIDYHYNAYFYKDGSILIDGEHDQVPNHEISIKYPGVPFPISVYEAESKRDKNGMIDFLYLVPGRQVGFQISR